MRTIRKHDARARLLALSAGAVLLWGRTARAQEPPKHGSLTLPSGRFEWGASVSLLRIGALRDPTLPGSTRRYETDLRTLNTELTFQLFYNPASRPWRRVDEGTLRSFQVMSPTAFLTLGLNDTNLSQSAISMGVGMGFLDNYLILGIGFDLYRGIPVQGGSGSPGGSTANTGLLSLVTSSEGEFTPENIFFVIHLNLLPLARRVP